MALLTILKVDKGPTYVETVMPSKLPSCVIGIDVGGTNVSLYLSSYTLYIITGYQRTLMPKAVSPQTKLHTLLSTIKQADMTNGNH